MGNQEAQAVRGLVTLVVEVVLVLVVRLVAEEEMVKIMEEDMFLSLSQGTRLKINWEQHLLAMFIKMRMSWIISIIL